MKRFDALTVENWATFNQSVRVYFKIERVIGHTLEAQKFQTVVDHPLVGGGVLSVTGEITTKTTK